MGDIEEAEGQGEEKIEKATKDRAKQSLKYSTKKWPL